MSTDRQRHALLTPHVVMRGLVLMATFAGIAFLVEGLGLKEAVDTNWVDSHIRGQGLHGEMLFVAVAAAFTAIGLPRQLVCFLGGYAFGLVEGTLWASVASVAGCMLAFYYARFMGRTLILARFSARIAKLDRFLSANAFNMTLLLRLLPVGSNLVTNLAGGVSAVRGLPFFGGSLLGYLPQTVVFALLGSGITVQQGLRIGLSVVGFVASAALGVWLYRRYRHGLAAFEGETEAELEGSE